MLYSSSYAKKVHASSTTALSQLLSKTELSVFLNYQLKHKLVSLLSNQKWMYHTQTETLISIFERTLCTTSLFGSFKELEKRKTTNRSILRERALRHDVFNSYMHSLATDTHCCGKRIFIEDCSAVEWCASSRPLREKP